MTSPTSTRPDSSHSSYFTPPSAPFSLPQGSPSPSPRRSPRIGSTADEHELKQRSISNTINGAEKRVSGIPRLGQTSRKSSGGISRQTESGQYEDDTRNVSPGGPSRIRQGIPISTRRISDAPSPNQPRRPSSPKAAFHGSPSKIPTSPKRPFPRSTSALPSNPIHQGRNISQTRVLPPSTQPPPLSVFEATPDSVSGPSPNRPLLHKTSTGSLNSSHRPSGIPLPMSRSSSALATSTSSDTTRQRLSPTLASPRDSTASTIPRRRSSSTSIASVLSPSETGETDDHLISDPNLTNRAQKRMSVIVPQRSTSSTTTSSLSMPQISPRKSSMPIFSAEHFPDPRKRSTPSIPSSSTNPSATTSTSRASSSSSMRKPSPAKQERGSFTSPTIASAAKVSTPFISTPSPDRRPSNTSIRSLPGSSPSGSRAGSPRRSNSPRVNTPQVNISSPKPERRSPGLRIQPPPPGMRRVSQLDRPSPPVPARSPLRGLPSQKSSFSELKTKANRPETAMSGSGESNTAEVGTPVSSQPPSATSTRSFNRLQTTAKAAEDIRFTMMTAPSVYSQDSATSSAQGSAPTSATWPQNEQTAMTPVTAGKMRDRWTRTNSISSWGTKKESRASLAETDDGTYASRSSSLAHLTISDKALPPPPPSTSPQTSTTVSNQTNNGHTPVTPQRIRDKPFPLRSPSMPSIATMGDSPSKAARVLGLAEDDIKMARTTSNPVLLPAATMVSPKTASLRPPLPHSPSSNLISKRAHLIREIATTERAYANDLALIRDAYVLRFLRPKSNVSTGTNGDSTDMSRRSSVYTYQTAETKRSSGHSDGNWNPSPIATLSGMTKSPTGSPYGLNTPSTASVSSVSIQQTPQPSPRAFGQQNRISILQTPPVGKTLTPADIKAVFLNLEQLAAGAEELATGFEKAMGEEESGPGALIRDGKGGTDRLGEVFMSLLPKLQPLYHFYCARQSQASSRLMDIQTDPGHQAYLNDCWALVKAHTHAWNLDSMLIKPIQRITKYPLLFDDLLACTGPVHPDYFSIRTAAEQSRSVAVEIDEAKRRKDMVERVIGSKKTTPNGTPITKSGNPRLLGLKRFRKDKTNGSSVSLATNSDPGPPTDITPQSFAQLKDAVNRLEDSDHCVRMLGKEILLWTAKAKEVFIFERDMMSTWMRVVQLEPTDGMDQRIVAFRHVTERIVQTAWQELDNEVKNQVMPALSRLLLLAVSPRAVISKRDSKLADYSRYIATRNAKRPTDKLLVTSASEFVAIHTQLVEELPAFLEGYTRIFDISVVGFAKAQAAYHAAIKTRLANFLKEWISMPRRKSSGVVNLDDELYDVSETQGIIEAWQGAWTPYAEAMGHFQCTRPARNTASRVASFNNRPGSRTASVNSRSNSPHESPILRHSPSITSTHSRSDSLRIKPNRTRSTSLIGQPDADKPMSPIKADSRFAILRRNSKTKPAEITSMPPPTSASPLQKRATTLMTIAQKERDPVNRHSFGLPQIAADKPMFEGLGLSPSRSRPSSTHGPHLTVRATTAPVGHSTSPDMSSPHPLSEFGASSSTSAQVTGLGLGDFDSRRDRTIRENTYRHPYAAASPSRAPEPKGTPAEIDASEGWRNEKVIYQCACVANFDPLDLGDKRYRGLRFLAMRFGDLVDVFHEVGRIDQLPAFPYTDIGVDNDGVLVGRTEGGDIGLVICSFLEPLRE